MKSVLRRLVENPEFVNLVLEKAGESGGSAAGTVEPRITRKLARTVVDSGGKLNWFLEKVSKTPRKVNPESLALMQVGCIHTVIWSCKFHGQNMNVLNKIVCNFVQNTV